MLEPVTSTVGTTAPGAVIALLCFHCVGWCASCARYIISPGFWDVWLVISSGHVLGARQSAASTPQSLHCSSETTTKPACKPSIQLSRFSLRNYRKHRHCRDYQPAIGNTTSVEYEFKDVAKAGVRRLRRGLPVNGSSSLAR